MKSGVATFVAIASADSCGALEGLPAGLAGKWLSPIRLAARSVMSTMAAASMPMAMTIASLISSLVAPSFRAFLMWPSMQPSHFATREQARAMSSCVLVSSAFLSVK
jgi:hypothetical protein